MTKKVRGGMVIAGLLVLSGGAYGVSALMSSALAIDPSRLVAAETGKMIRSVVATGKIQPIAKVEICHKEHDDLATKHTKNTKIRQSNRYSS